MKSYEGQCHCGTVTFSVAADIDNVLECNCSICHTTGWQLTFVQAEQFNLTSGEGETTDYQFADKNLHHPFCKHCGVHAFSWGNSADGAKMFSVNTRCLKNFDASQVTINHYDGASQ